MDLFVLDTAGDNTALEDRAVPLIERPKQSSYIEATSADDLQHRDDDLFTDHEDDDEDDDDDDGDYGEFPRDTCLTADISKLLPKKADHLSIDPITEAVEQFKRLMATISERAANGEPWAEPKLALTDVQLQMKDCVNEGIEHQHALPNPSEKNKAKLRKQQASTTKGKKWFDMPATELTDEVKRDLELIQMRSVLDPKHFYKKNDLKVLPKYFQVGKVLPSALEHHNERGTRVGKKKTIVDELMADAQFQRFNKRKYTETVDEQKRNGLQKAHSKAKKLKKKK